MSEQLNVENTAFSYAVDSSAILKNFTSKDVKNLSPVVRTK